MVLSSNCKKVANLCNNKYNNSFEYIKVLPASAEISRRTGD